MSSEPSRSVGLRELRHRTSDVLTRVRRGETVDVTDRGKLIARIVPAHRPELSPLLVRLAESGRVRLAERPGYRPPMHPGDGTNRLSDAVREMRDEQRW